MANETIECLLSISDHLRGALQRTPTKPILTPLQKKIMLYLNRCLKAKEPCRASDIAAHMELTKATISDSLRSLVKKELIKTKLSKIDSRSFIISITRDGRIVINNLEGYAWKIEKVLHRLPAGDRKKLTTDLKRIITEIGRNSY